MSAAKHFSGLRIFRNDVMDAHRALLEGKGTNTNTGTGAGCIRHLSPERIDFELVARMPKATAGATGAVCG